MEDGIVAADADHHLFPAINLLRTRLQASGSPGHPQVYTGFRDVLSQTLKREGWFGLYKGLIPTLAKVVPAVSISYVVCRHTGPWNEKTE